MPRAEPLSVWAKAPTAGGDALPMRPSRMIGLGRKQLQHLALEVAFAVRHAREMRAIDRRLAGRQRRRHPLHRAQYRFPRGRVFPLSSAIFASRGSSSPLARRVWHGGVKARVNGGSVHNASG